MNKPFSQQHYDEDDHAKYQILEWLRTKDYKCEINPDQYGIDILGKRWGKNFQFEVEVKHNWHGQFFHMSRFISLQGNASSLPLMPILGL